MPLQHNIDYPRGLIPSLLLTTLEPPFYTASRLFHLIAGIKPAIRSISEDKRAKI